MPQEFQSNETQFLEGVRKQSGLTIVLGVIIMLIGLMAMGSPFIAGLSIAVMVGVMLIVGGVGQLLFAFTTSRQLSSIVLGILTVVVGVYMVNNPDAVLATLTIFLVAYLIISGVFEVLMSFQIKPAEGWGWEFFSGIVSILLGIMFWSQYPISGALAIGIILGIKLFLSGLTLLMFGFAARDAAK